MNVSEEIASVGSPQEHSEAGPQCKSFMFLVMSFSLQCPGHILILSTWINNRSNSTGYRAIRLQTLKNEKTLK